MDGERKKSKFQRARAAMTFAFLSQQAEDKKRYTDRDLER